MRRFLTWLLSWLIPPPGGTSSFPEKDRVAEAVAAAEAQLGKLQMLMHEEYETLQKLRSQVAARQKELGKLDGTWTIKKLRAQIAAQTETNRRLMQELQEAHKRAEDEAMGRNAALHFNIRMPGGY